MKTISETILSFPGVGDVGEFLDTVLINRSLSGTEEYTVSQKKIVNLAVADVYSWIGGLPDFTENKLTIKYPRDWYVQKAMELYNENGEPENAALLGKKITVPRGKAPRSW